MSTDYTAASIKSLTPQQHLRKRMSLTFGPVEHEGYEFSAQKSVALRELQDNALDEVRAGYGADVKVSFYKDRSFEVYDSGRGIPVDISKDAHGNPASGIYLALGVIQSGGKFELNSKSFSSGLNGVGASSTVAVSLRADVTVYRNKKEHRLSFKDGVPGFFDGESGPEDNFRPAKDFAELLIAKDTRPREEQALFPTGTKIKVWLDDSAFSSSHPYNDQDIIDRLRSTAFLVPQLKVSIYNELHEQEDPKTGELKPQEEYFNFPDGMKALLELNQVDTPLIASPVRVETQASYIEKNVPVLQADGSIKNQSVERELPIELMFSYGNGYERRMFSFVNTLHTKIGGVHEVAFERALMAAFNERFDSMRGLLSKSDELPKVDDYMEGLTAVLSVQISEPVFTSQSKEALSGIEVRKAIQEALTEELRKWIKAPANQADLKAIAAKVTTAAKNRQQAQSQRDLQRQKNELKQSTLPESLIDCELSGTDAAELYICEGDSAKTSLKAARDGRVNALLGVRGKIINAYGSKNKMSDVLKSKPVQEIIKSLGAGAGHDFDIEQVRYGKVFFAVDADVDGNAIAVGLYALFWVLFRPMVEAGRLYKIETPLFSILTSQGKKSTKHYARNEADRDDIMAKLDKQNIKYRVSRLKGLGEMKEDDLEETAINPETRIITQITSEDLEAAKNALDIAIGDDVSIRKAWIESSEIDEEELLS